MSTELTPNVKAAFSFYSQFILQHSQAKAAIYQQYGFTLQGSVSSKDWEVFAAILVGDRARSGNGTDLINHEVKSAVIGGAFEYQYHRHHGIEKLAADKQVDHIFISRSNAYEDIQVWVVDRQDLIPTFDRWLPELQANYAASAKQRFRKSVSSEYVRRYGQSILTIVQGQLADSPGSEPPAD